MAEPTLTQTLQTLIKDTIQQQNNPPQLGTIKKIYDDGYIDIQTTEGTITHLECIGTPTLNKKGIIIFINNEENNLIVVV